MGTELFPDGVVVGDGGVERRRELLGDVISPSAKRESVDIVLSDCVIIRHGGLYRGRKVGVFVTVFPEVAVGTGAEDDGARLVVTFIPAFQCGITFIQRESEINFISTYRSYPKYYLR